MKKLIALLLAMVMVFALAACGSSSNSTASAPAASNTEAAPAEQTEAAPADEGKNYDTVNILFTCNGTDVGNDTRTARLLAERLQERSGGKITMTINNNDALASGAQTSAPELVINGTVQMDLRSTTVLGAVAPPIKVSTLPFVFEDYADTIEYTWGKGGDFYTKVLDGVGLTYLGGMHNGLAVMTNNKHEVAVPADIKGLKIRSVGDQLQDFWTALGASAQGMNWSEVYTAMQQGTIDGHSNSFSTIWSNNIQEVQKYFTTLNFSYELFIFTANSAWFNSLTPDTQELIRDTIKEVSLEMDAVLEAEEQEIMEKIQAEPYNCEVHVTTPEERQQWIDALGDFMAKWTAFYGEEACVAFDIPMG